MDTQEGDLSYLYPKVEDAGASAPTGQVSKPLQQGYPKTQEPPSIGGFAENVAHDAWENFKGIGTGILTGFKGVADAPGQIYDIIKNRKYWDAAPIADEMKKVRDKLGDALIEKYTKYTPDNAGLGERLGQAAYNEPIGTLLDFMVVKDLTAGAAKTAGKLGMGPLRDFGEALDKFPGNQIRNFTDKAAAKVGMDLPARRLALDIGDEEASIGKQRATQDKNNVLSAWQGLTDEQRDAAHSLAMRGATPEELAAVQSDQKVMKAADAYRDYVQDIRQEGLKARGVADDGMFENRVAKQYAKARYGEVTPELEAKAYEEIPNLARKPVYVPTEAELRSGRNLDEILMERQDIPQGKIPLLEKYTGQKPLSADPRKYIPRVIDSFRSTEAKLRTYDRIISEPTLAKSAVSKEALAKTERELGQASRTLEKVKGTAEATAAQAKVDELTKALGGMKQSVAGGEELSKTLPTTGFYKKYIDEAGRAQGLRFNEMVREFGSPEKALEALKTQQGLMHRLNATSEIIANPTVRRMLQMEFTKLGGVPGALLGAYDKMINLFRAGGTAWNPRWYLGMSVGQSILSLLAGAFPGGFKMAREFENALPPQVAGKLAPDVARMAHGPFWQIRDFHDAITTDVKAGMITKFAAKRLTRTATNADLMEKGLKQTMPELLSSTRDLSDIQMARQQLHEGIVKQVGQRLGLDREIAEARVALQKAEMEMYPSVGEIPDRAADIPAEVLNKTLDELKQKITNLEAHRTAIAGDYEQRAIEAGRLNQQVPRLERLAEITRGAVHDANTFIGSHNLLGPVEKYVFRRLIPFYDFNKAMTMLAFRLPFVAPLSAFMWHRMSAWVTSMTQDPNLPEELHGYWPMFAKEDGSTEWISLKGLSHSGGLRVSHFGGLPVPAMANPVESSPALNLVARMAGMKTEFDVNTVPFTSDEPKVSLHTGDVYKAVNGSWQKTQNQLPLISGIAHYFPTVQFAEQLLTPYRITSHNWVGIPEPELNPDGSYKFPKELLERVAGALGVKLKARSVEDAERSEMLKSNDAIKTMAKMLKGATPDQEEYIRGAIEDYQNGFLRKVKR